MSTVAASRGAKKEKRTRASHERLSALDASFLAIESDAVPMHVGAVLIFDGAPLHGDEGRLAMERLRRYLDHALDSCERYRQRLEPMFGMGQPVWVDDDRFDLDFHLRRANLPTPGSERELKVLAGRLLSQKLDQSRPLWEMYVVEGLEGNRVAMVLKAHHCMVDGVGGMQLLMALLRPSASSEIPKAEAEWKPRPAPSRLQLLRSELRYRFDAAKALVELVSWEDLRSGASGMWNALKAGLSGSGATTSFTAPARSPYRRFDWASFDLDEIKAIKDSLGGTVNDVVLAITCGAARRYLERQGTDLENVENLTAALPVHIGGSARSEAGNQVAMLLAELPVNEPDPSARLRRIAAQTARLKEDSNQTAGAKLFEEVADVAAHTLLSGVFELAAQVGAFDLIVTNVRGPSFPLYLLGARLQAVYPVVPLMAKQTLGIALFSYAGSIHWGFNAEWEQFATVRRFVEDLEASFDELRHAAQTPQQTGSELQAAP